MSVLSSSLTDRQLVQSLGRAGLELLGQFPELRESQRAAAPPILGGQSVLLSCATASGKTEAILAPLLARVLACNPKRDRPAVLAIAPTRALVNDLHRRLKIPLERMGLTCARQSSDHRATLSNAFVLVTTPESLDSLLARRTLFSKDGKPVGHELSEVHALFVDEVHLFDNTARGDQLQWLIARLKRVMLTSDHPRQLQLCAASATVSDPAALASRLLGPSMQVVTVDGSRRIRLFTTKPEPHWRAVERGWAIDHFRAGVNLLGDSNVDRQVCELIWQVLSSVTAHDQPRKLLLFTPTRAACDSMSVALKAFLHPLRQLKVLAHHGSLSKHMREMAEQEFNGSRDAVLVATTTLEVGVDIGDVDAVVLIGPASDTAGLMQRIGRSGRREGVTRVVACASSLLEQAALASMLMAASRGEADAQIPKRSWSVVVQQISSFTYQAGNRGRKISDVLQLAFDTWGAAGRENAAAIIEHLLQEGAISKGRDDRITNDGAWVKAWEGMGMHGNIGANQHTIPMVDSMTGATIAEVPISNASAGAVSLAGSQWKTVFRNGELVATSSSERVGAPGGIRYGGSQAPVTFAFGRHAALGCGLGPNDLVEYDSDIGVVIFHFGGSAFEKTLLSLPVFKSARPLVRGICFLLGPGGGLDSTAALLQRPEISVSLSLDEGAWRTYLPTGLPGEQSAKEEGRTLFCAWWGTRRWLNGVDWEQGKLLKQILESAAVIKTSPN